MLDVLHTASRLQKICDCARRQSERHSGMKAAKEKNILVVDDEETVRDSLASILSREGYRVSMAESGDEALRILKDQPIQLVISDHNMPQMTGIEFLKLVRERHPHVLRIMLTGAG